MDARQARADRLAGDPVARGATGLLTGSAVLAFVVALLALVLLVVAERRDEAAQLYAWESDGVRARGPCAGRCSCGRSRWSWSAVPGGVLIGLLLSRLTTALVRLTAVGTDPVPPLALAVSALWSVLAVAVGIVCRPGRLRRGRWPARAAGAAAAPTRGGAAMTPPARSPAPTTCSASTRRRAGTWPRCAG